jgi:uncharacterized protein (TIRG00374 family)
MEMKKTLNKISQVALSLLLGGAILYWMYRDFDFDRISYVMFHEMNWTWMLLSFPFGILAQAIRGWRWRQTLDPVGEHPRRSVAVYSIYISYASSLVIPRIGELARCAILRRWDKVSVPKSLGTVVTERAIDSVLVAVITGLTFLWQLPVFTSFFRRTGTRIDQIFSHFTTVGWWVTILCALAALTLIFVLLRRLSIYNKVKDTFIGLWSGIISVKNVRNMPLFIFFTIAIWASYFLHYYLTFFCFDATSHLGVACALVTFIVGSIAVIVPTPNGAGPWHFAVKTMLILYGVASNDALYFVLIVHTIQTLLVVALGIFGWIALNFIPKRA